jgi:hypothetical protein
MATLYSPSFVTDGLVLFLDAGNPKSYLGSGTAWNDLSGRGNSGALVNGVSYTADSGGSLVFDGADDSVLISHTATLNAYPLTMSSWVYLNTNLGIDIINKYVGNSYNGYRMGVNSRSGGQPSGVNVFYFYGGINGGRLAEFNSSFGNVSSQQWNMITATVDATGGKVYINDKLVGTLSWSGAPEATTTTQPLRLGTYIASSQAFLNGQIANTQIYNRALSIQEIQNNFNALRGRFGL